MSNLHTSPTAKRPMSMEPKKFALWLFIVSVVMFFAAFTSAYIVRQADGNWFHYDIPSVFYYSTVIILLSSATMHWATLATKQDDIPKIKLALIITTVLGFGFLITQFIGYKVLVAADVYFVGNPSGSFFYVITGVHGLHIVSGIIYLLITLASSFKFKIHSKSMLQVEMCATYWHFLGVLWVYLLVFMMMNR